MVTLNLIPESLTAEEAAGQIAELAPQIGITQHLPDVRTLRLWRTKKQLSLEGRRFTRRNLIEVLAMLKLRHDGLTHQAAAQRVLAADEDRLMLMLTEGFRDPARQTDAEPVITLQLLAAGILEQYRLTQRGAIVGHTDHNRTGMVNMPLKLHQAMTHLSRHYFEDEQEDLASSVHQLLCLCTTPLEAWAPRSLAAIEAYRGAVLIDPDYRVPSEDCEAIAEEADGANLSDLVERHLHDSLRETLKKLGSGADSAYTTIREFVGRHPLATSSELQGIYWKPELNEEAIAFVRSLYVPLHAGLVRGDLATRCTHCRALIGTDGKCSLAGCSEDEPTRVGEHVPLDHAYVARPDVRKYWSDPAREELRLYDALRASRAMRDRVQLYPHSDWCDVAIGEEVGVDVKDYRDPARLAQRLNRSIGQLEHYPERILAIARRRWKLPFYRDRLLEHLFPARQAQLKIMSVDQAISYLKKSNGGRNHAKDA